jgi:hypothetical protein
MPEAMCLFKHRTRATAHNSGCTTDVRVQGTAQCALCALCAPCVLRATCSDHAACSMQSAMQCGCVCSMLKRKVHRGTGAGGCRFVCVWCLVTRLCMFVHAVSGHPALALHMAYGTYGTRKCAQPPTAVACLLSMRTRDEVRAGNVQVLERAAT